MKELCNSEVYYLVAQECKEANSCKNDRFKYEMIGATQPDMEVLEVVAVVFHYKHLFTISKQFNPICNQNLILQHSIAGFYVQF